MFWIRIEGLAERLLKLDLNPNPYPDSDPHQDVGLMLQQASLHVKHAVAITTSLDDSEIPEPFFLDIDPDPDGGASALCKLGVTGHPTE